MRKHLAAIVFAVYSIHSGLTSRANLVSREDVLNGVTAAAFVFQHSIGPLPSTRESTTAPAKSDVGSLIAQEGRQILPDRLYSTDSSSLLELAKQPLPVAEGHGEIVTLLIRERLLDLLAMSKYEQQTGPLAEDLKKAIQESVSKFCEDLARSLKDTSHKAAWGISDRDIDAITMLAKEALSRHIGDNTRVTLWHAISSEDLTGFLKDMESRIQRSGTRAKQRIDGAREGDVDTERKKILNEIVSTSTNVFLKKTIDPARQKVQPEDYVPEIRDVRRRIEILRGGDGR